MYVKPRGIEEIQKHPEVCVTRPDYDETMKAYPGLSNAEGYVITAINNSMKAHGQRLERLAAALDTRYGPTGDFDSLTKEAKKVGCAGHD